MRWISIHDRLPEHLQPIIFYVDVDKSQNAHSKFIAKLVSQFNKSELQFVDFGYAVIDECETGKFLSHVSRVNEARRYIYRACDDFITHWMPLPNPPNVGAVHVKD